jgi:hypothetical protein
MIFGRVCVICDDFGDYHDEIAIMDFSGRQTIYLWPLSAREAVLLGAPYQDNDSGSSSVAAKRKSSFEGDKSASYVIPDDATADIPKRWILRHVQCFGVDHRILA